jgi:hypothetical protein
MFSLEITELEVNILASGTEITALQIHGFPFIVCLAFQNTVLVQKEMFRFIVKRILITKHKNCFVHYCKQQDRCIGGYLKTPY